MHQVLTAYSLSECMEIMAEYASAYEAQGKYNLIFCEDRLTLIAERALLRRVGATFRSHVSTFARFLKTDYKTISKQGSVMAVGEVMTRLQRENALKCFVSLSGIGNNALCIYETLAQLSASEITPEILRESLQLLPDDMLRKKVADIALIYEGYTDFLRDGRFIDESKYLSLLPSAIRKDESLKDVNVFFLGYSAFTVQARETIRAVMDTAANVIGIFCSGEEEIYANRAAEAFCGVCKEYGKFKVCDLGKPLEGDAECLRKGLFNPYRPAVKKETENIEIFEADDKTLEAEHVAMKIRRLVTENSALRYRDVAVLIPNVAEYVLPLKKAFGEYGIPYFINEKKTLRRHPVSSFLLDCFRCVRERFSALSVQSLTQNVFFGESDDYRNYLLRFANYRGGVKKPIKSGDAVKEYDVARMEEGRRKVLLATENIKARGYGRDYCRAVRKILEDFDVDGKLKELEEVIADVAQKSYLAQISRVLESLLQEAEMLMGGKEMTVAEFEVILKDGLDATEISLIPVKTDAVFIGDITDSRIEKVNVVFAMGMTESVPRASSDTAIISDKEIARLAEVKAMLEPTVAEVNLRARERVCLNLCSFTDRLYLSYPLAADGSEPALSEIFRYIDTLFCDKNGGKLPRRKKHTSADFQYKCAAVTPAIRQLLIEKTEYEAQKEDTRLEYSSLFTALDKLGVSEKDDYLVEYRGQVCVERGEELFFRDGKISPTSLEGYFACPFRHFAERGLRLKEREEATVLAVDTGNFIHELLQRSSVEFSNIKSEADFRKYAYALGEELLKSSAFAMQQDTASGVFSSEKILKEGVDVATAAYRQMAESDFTLERTESNVSSEFFHGKVDRVDGTDKYVRVVDYKTGSIDDSATSYYTGQKLQMQLYMSELKGERIPAGVFYFPASVSYRDEEDGRFRMKGFMNGDREAVLCGDRTLENADETKKSEHFPAALKNSAASKRVMDEETFVDFIDYSVHVARQGCKELKEGFIAPSPYEGSCQYCKYGGMCGVDKSTAPIRKESTIAPQTIANIAKEKREGGE